ncbi:cystatin-F [Embiotoca jacksoni]|uniref:cystatin-F n=1 Tax=Embiotoca jacksoni TaxID=100190 RepID=UPI003703BDEC
MMGVKRLLLVCVLTALGAGLATSRFVPGAPSNISSSDRSLHQVVLDAAYFYNNQSNDAFLFKPSAILRAQRQVVRGILYIVDLNISRTVCRKRNVNIVHLSSCQLQPAGRLQQTLQCHADVWLIPWQKQTKTALFCKP